MSIDFHSKDKLTLSWPNPANIDTKLAFIVKCGIYFLVFKTLLFILSNVFVCIQPFIPKMLPLMSEISKLLKHLEETATSFVYLLGLFPAHLLNYLSLLLNNQISGLKTDNGIITIWDLAVALTMAAGVRTWVWSYQTLNRMMNAFTWNPSRIRFSVSKSDLFLVWVADLRVPSVTSSVYNSHHRLSIVHLPPGASESRLLFADDVALSAPAGHDLQLSVEQQLSVNLGWRPKAKVTDLSWNKEKYLLLVKNESLPQEEEFKLWSMRFSNGWQQRGSFFFFNQSGG